MSTTIITRPRVEIESDLLAEMKNQINEAGQVILHILYSTPIGMPSYIRIWPTTYLFDKDSPHKSELVHAENITYYPYWYECLPGKKYYFSLIFSGLPKSCTRFDFVEQCTNQSGAFEVRNIDRNQSDVYFLKMY